MRGFFSKFGQKGENCKHLVKYQGTIIDIAGVSIPNIFSYGNVSIKPQILQATEKAIQYLDMSHFQNCENLKQVSDKESKAKYLERMTKQYQKLKDIAIAIAAYSTNTNSQVLEETLSNILKSNLGLHSENEDEIKKKIEIDISMKDIDTKGDVEGAKIGKMTEGKLNSSMEKIKTKGGIKGPIIGQIDDQPDPINPPTIAQRKGSGPEEPLLSPSPKDDGEGSEDKQVSEPMPTPTPTPMPTPTPTALPKSEQNYAHNDGINISGYTGDIIGVGFKGAGNIVGKNIIVTSSSQNQKIKRYTYATLPSKMYLEDVKPLRVILKVRKPQPPQTNSISNSVGEVDISISKNVKEVPVLVIVDPDNPKFEVEGGEYFKTINVPTNDEDSKPIIFNIKAKEEGLAKIKIEFFHQAGDYLGQLEITTMIVSSGHQEDVAPPLSIAEGLEFKQFIQAPSSVTLVIVQTASQPKGKYDIIFFSDSYGVLPVGSIELDNDPESKFKEIFKDIENTDLPPNVVDDRISNKGISLYEELVPQQLKDLYWKIRDNIKSIQIYSKEPWIPWEIIKPWRLQDNGEPEEDHFLCERFVFSRWLIGRKKETKEFIEKVKIIVPSDTELENSINERDWIIEEFMNKKGFDVSVDSSYDEVRNTLRTSGYDLIHISSHGKHTDNMPLYSVIELEDGLTIRPEDIGGMSTAFGRSNPVVFLNTCQSGSMGISLTGIQSWVTKFIEAGASIFVGTLWSVNSKTAFDFAKELYIELEKGTTIGEAVRVARAKCKKSGDPSWLSYQLYGQPNIQIKFRKGNNW
jgi:hypothetical protein